MRPNHQFHPPELRFANVPSFSQDTVIKGSAHSITVQMICCTAVVLCFGETLPCAAHMVEFRCVYFRYRLSWKHTQRNSTMWMFTCSKAVCINLPFSSISSLTHSNPSSYVSTSALANSSYSDFSLSFPSEQCFDVRCCNEN